LAEVDEILFRNVDAEGVDGGLGAASVWCSHVIPFWLGALASVVALKVPLFCGKGGHHLRRAVRPLPRATSMETFTIVSLIHRDAARDHMKRMIPSSSFRPARSWRVDSFHHKHDAIYRSPVRTSENAVNAKFGETLSRRSSQNFPSTHLGEYSHRAGPIGLGRGVAHTLREVLS